MDPSTVDTEQLHDWLDRMRAGDAGATNELLSRVGCRLERLARQMLRQFPRVARWEETDDVLQKSVLRLLRALEDVRPDSVRAFFALAAQQMRRELLDLVRHYQGPQGLGANHSSRVSRRDAAVPDGRLDPAAHGDADDLDRWAAFHQQVEQLPNEEREVFGLVFYHGWTQAEIAALFQASERTIRRRWQSACDRLQQSLGRHFPEP